MTNIIFRTLHRSVIVIATLMKTSPNHTRQGLKCRVGLAAVLVVVEHLAVVQERGGRSCPKLTDDGQEWWSIAKT